MIKRMQLLRPFRTPLEWPCSTLGPLTARKSLRVAPISKAVTPGAQWWHGNDDLKILVTCLIPGSPKTIFLKIGFRQKLSFKRN